MKLEGIPFLGIIKLEEMIYGRMIDWERYEMLVTRIVNGTFRQEDGVGFFYKKNHFFSQ